MSLAVPLVMLSSGSAGAQAEQRTPFTPPLIGQPQTGIGIGEASFRDKVFRGDFPTRGGLQKAAAAVTYPDGDGHAVSIEVSDGYLPSAEADQALAEFFGSLLHGSEMNRLKVYVATPSEIPEICGGEAAACYSGRSNEMVIVGEAEFGGFPTGYVAAHEYGHHIANNRKNDPWPAIAFGPKRWASYERVCPLSVSGKYFPGNQGKHYYDNPGEAFAEAYAQYDSRYRSFPWEWNFGLKPDATSYSLIQADVLNPWSGNSVSRSSARIRRGRLFTRAFRTPLDGNLTLKLRGPRRADFDLFLRKSDGTVLKKSKGRKSREEIRFTICGESRLKFTVYAYRGSGRAQVALSKP